MNQPQQSPQVTAHYTKSRAVEYVAICHGMTVRGEFKRVPVKGKREADRVAREHNATPWNF